MGRADTQTLLPIDTWARNLDINPDAFNQCVKESIPYPDGCTRIWLQNGYHDTEQGTILGREDVAFAIAEAEAKVHEYCHWNIAPTWTVSEMHEWPLAKRGDQCSIPPIVLDNGYIVSGGIEASTLVETNAPITYTDRDGDGIPDTASITILSATLAAASAGYFELAVYYPSEYLDFTFYPRDETWRIKPLNIVRNPTTGDVTIWGHRSQFVRPDLWLTIGDIDSLGIELSDDANFITYVDVYRRYNDPSQSAQLVYKSGSGVFCSSTSLCSESCQTACIQVENDLAGHVLAYPATYSGGSFTSASPTSWPPSAVRYWYLSGYHRRFDSWIEADWMSQDIAKAITMLSLNFLSSPLCGCKQTISRYEWAVSPDPFRTPLTNADAALCASAFGVCTRGALLAYDTFKRLGPLFGAGNL